MTAESTMTTSVTMESATTASGAIKKGGKLLGIESGRGIAAMLVVFYHAARHMQQDIGYLPLHGIANFGHAGVDFFFVLSGFIIYYVHGFDFSHPERLGHYIERRFTRIYPFFWCVLAVTLVLAALSTHQPFPGIARVVKTFFLFPQIEDPIVGVAWTLELEVVFYLIFACAILSARWGIALFSVWLGFILACGVTGYVSTHSALLNELGRSFDIEFFFGIAAAVIIRRKIKLPRGLLPIGAILFLLAGTVENLGHLDGFGTLARYAYGLPAFMILLGLAERERAGRLKLHPLLVTLGSASYAIYLTHLISIGVIYKLLSVTKLLGVLPVTLTYLALCIGSIAAAVLISRYVEYPLMGRVRRILA
ncbi:MAG TPA: acyltransferase [Rhodocyclaceae bacterium]|nr:acyltransferase [Rhodocyclaceae bacterium]